MQHTPIDHFIHIMDTLYIAHTDIDSNISMLLANTTIVTFTPKHDTLPAAAAVAAVVVACWLVACTLRTSWVRRNKRHPGTCEQVGYPPRTQHYSQQGPRQ